jgi:hypothetical protein
MLLPADRNQKLKVKMKADGGAMYATTEHLEWVHTGVVLTFLPCCHCCPDSCGGCVVVVGLMAVVWWLG